jgi:hypothetical protein
MDVGQPTTRQIPKPISCSRSHQTMPFARLSHRSAELFQASGWKYLQSDIGKGSQDSLMTSKVAGPAACFVSEQHRACQASYRESSDADFMHTSSSCSHPSASRTVRDVEIGCRTESGVCCGSTDHCILLGRGSIKYARNGKDSFLSVLCQ